jgi:polygalacturonase
VLHRCRNVSITGLMLQHIRPPSAPTTESIAMHDCQNVTMTGCQIINARERGILLSRCAVVRVAACTIRGRADDKSYRTPLAVEKDCRDVMIVNNFLGRGSDGDWRLPDDIGLASANVML